MGDGGGAHGSEPSNEFVLSVKQSDNFAESVCEQFWDFQLRFYSAGKIEPDQTPLSSHPSTRSKSNSIVINETRQFMEKCIDAWNKCTRDCSIENPCFGRLMYAPNSAWNNSANSNDYDQGFSLTDITETLMQIFDQPPDDSETLFHFVCKVRLVPCCKRTLIPLSPHPKTETPSENIQKSKLSYALAQNRGCFQNNLAVNYFRPLAQVTLLGDRDFSIDISHVIEIKHLTGRQEKHDGVEHSSRGVFAVRDISRGTMITTWLQNQGSNESMDYRLEKSFPEMVEPSLVLNGNSTEDDKNVWRRKGFAQIFNHECNKTIKEFSDPSIADSHAMRYIFSFYDYRRDSNFHYLQDGTIDNALENVRKQLIQRDQLKNTAHEQRRLHSPLQIAPENAIVSHTALSACSFQEASRMASSGEITTEWLRTSDIDTFLYWWAEKTNNISHVRTQRDTTIEFDKNFKKTIFLSSNFSQYFSPTGLRDATNNTAETNDVQLFNDFLKQFGARLYNFLVSESLSHQYPFPMYLSFDAKTLLNFLEMPQTGEIIALLRSCNGDRNMKQWKWMKCYRKIVSSVKKDTDKYFSVLKSFIQQIDTEDEDQTTEDFWISFFQARKAFERIYLSTYRILSPMTNYNNNIWDEFKQHNFRLTKHLRKSIVHTRVPPYRAYCSRLLCENDNILMPYYFGNHWVLVQFDITEVELYVQDSFMPSSLQKNTFYTFIIWIRMIASWELKTGACSREEILKLNNIVEKINNKLNKTEQDNWNFIVQQRIKQSDGSSCGVITLLNLAELTLKSPPESPKQVFNAEVFNADSALNKVFRLIIMILEIYCTATPICGGKLNPSDSIASHTEFLEYDLSHFDDTKVQPWGGGNLYVIHVSSDNFPYLFMASRNISAGEELVFTYRYDDKPLPFSKCFCKFCTSKDQLQTHWANMKKLFEAS